MVNGIFSNRITSENKRGSAGKGFGSNIFEELEARRMYSITFNVTYDSSFTSLMSNPSAAEKAFVYATKELNGLTSQNVNINLDVAAVSGSSSIPGTVAETIFRTTFANLRNKLLANDPSLQFATSDPISGTHQWEISTAEGKILGYSTNPTYDALIVFAAGDNYNYSTTNRAVSNEFDFVGLSENYISNAMGRFAGLGEDLDGVPTYYPLDLFRVSYSQPHVHVYTPSVESYFSTTNGAETSVNRIFNTNSSAPYGDWGFLAPTLPESCTAIPSTGYELDFGTEDVSVMNALGYD